MYKTKVQNKDTELVSALGVGSHEITKKSDSGFDSNSNSDLLLRFVPIQQGLFANPPCIFLMLDHTNWRTNSRYPQ
jgi:hypothetical protein